MNDIRAIIKKERSHNKENLEDIAKKIGTSYSTLSRFLSGKTISVDVVEKLLDHFNLAIVKKF